MQLLDNLNIAPDIKYVFRFCSTSYRSLFDSLITCFALKVAKQQNIYATCISAVGGLLFTFYQSTVCCLFSLYNQTFIFTIIERTNE